MKRFSKQLFALAGLLTLLLALAACSGDSSTPLPVVVPVAPVLTSAEQTGSYTQTDLKSLFLTTKTTTPLSSSFGTPVDTVSAVDVRSYATQQIQTVEIKNSISQDSGILENLWKILLDTMYSFLLYDVTTYKITYDGAGYKNLTGLLVVPSDRYNPTRSFPMLSYQHPTQVLRSQSPSNHSKDFTFDDELTIPFALALGASGYITVVADYPGLGGNKDVHPYCLKTLGPVVTTMMQASQEQLAKLKNAGTWKGSFNGDLYLMGFSEGGYATVVTAQDVQQNHKEYNLKKVAALDGPHSLSDTMRTLMLTADSSFTAPYFLPYVVNGFGEAYGSTVSIMKFENGVLNPTVKNPQTGADESFNPKLKERLYGDYSGGDISSYMRLVSPYNGPRSILTKGFLDGLNDKTSSIFEKLMINDSVYGWSPDDATKVRFIHYYWDDLVPYENSSIAYKAWKSKSNVDLYPFFHIIPFLGSNHAGALIPALSYGFNWIYRE
jgi:hypothetical protein